MGRPLDQLGTAPLRVVGVTDDEHGMGCLHVEKSLVAVDPNGADQLDLLAVLVDHAVGDAEGVILFLALQEHIFIVSLKEQNEKGQKEQAGGEKQGEEQGRKYDRKDQAKGKSYGKGAEHPDVVVDGHGLTAVAGFEFHGDSLGVYDADIIA